VGQKFLRIYLTTILWKIGVAQAQLSIFLEQQGERCQNFRIFWCTLGGLSGEIGSTRILWKIGVAQAQLSIFLEQRTGPLPKFSEFLVYFGGTDPTRICSKVHHIFQWK
jgi:hypothetical protein